MSKGKKIKVLSIALAVLLCAGLLSACGKPPEDEKIVINLDGGGDTANFNSSLSMVPSETNPFPYNTLEKLIEEWEAKNPKYDVKLRRTSYGGDRNTLLPLLKGSNAPDIIYQNAAVLSLDYGLGYYADMGPYLELPNPYNGNKPWKEVYVQDELVSTAADDGKYYYINMERIATGIIYNKTLFAQHGIKVPETFDEFMTAQSTLKSKGVTPFLSSYNWYDIVLESNVFSRYIAELDLNGDRNIKMEELCHAYYTGKLDLTVSSEANFEAGLRKAYEVFIDRICEKKQYEPLGAGGFDAVTSFLLGQSGMIEATSEAMRKVYYDTERPFEVGVIPYPMLTEGAYANASYPGAGNGIRRGSAGTASSWWVTSTAIKNNTVDACADLLMFLTTPENNNRMIGDLAGAIPLSPTAEVEEYLMPLVEAYAEDLQNPEIYSWASMCTWQICGLTFTGYFQTQINHMLSKRNSSTGIVADADRRLCADNLLKQMKIVLDENMAENEYDWIN